MTQRNLVYACEDRLETLIGHRPVWTMGKVWQLEPDMTFPTLPQAQLWATLTCMERGLPPVTVRLRGGDRVSHYSPTPPTIALASWGGTRRTLCHELAHHATVTKYGIAGHGPQFRAAMCDLLAATGAPQQAQLLRDLFNDSGLATATG